MNIEILYPLVSEAIRRAETLDDLRAPGARDAYLDVSLLEERIADALPAADPEGALARRGAVRAALAAKDFARAHGLADRFLAETGEESELRTELSQLSQQAERSTVASEPRDVFILYVDESASRHEVTHFVEHLGLRPVILDERPDRGRSIIERLESLTDALFAIVLLSWEDLDAQPAIAARSRLARQNVIFELGYLVAHLGLQRVCALYSEGIEVPSDLEGKLYLRLDSQGGWKQRVAKKIEQTRMRTHRFRASR